MFYPDYIISVKDKTRIIQTKGDFIRTGNSEDIDKFSPKKSKVLKTYLDKHDLCGGFVREDKQSTELCICTENNNDNVHSESWVLLKELF